MESKIRYTLKQLVVITLLCSVLIPIQAQLIISEISPNSEIEALEQYGGGEWFEICNVGEESMDISGYTIGHYEDASFGQSDFYLGMDQDNCDCGGSYGVVKLAGSNTSGDVILPPMECLVISGMNIDCSDAYYCINARDLMLNGPSGIVSAYNSSRTDYPGSGNGNGQGALEGHYWRQKNYECNAYYIWNAQNEIIDAVNFNCLPQTGPSSNANVLSGGFHYPDGNGGYYSYPPSFPTPPAGGPFPVGIEITNELYTWVGESIEEGFTFQRCSNDPTFVFPPMKYGQDGQPTGNYYTPTCGQPNDNCCSSCDNNDFFQGIQLPACTNGSAIGLVIEINEQAAEQEVLTSQAPSCNTSESRLRSNYDENTISFCTIIQTPNSLVTSQIGFVHTLDEVIAENECADFTYAELYKTDECDVLQVNAIVSTNGRPIFNMEANTEYTLCFNYDISSCAFKNRMYWDNPCFSPYYCALQIECPDVIQDTVLCLADVPNGITDTMLFRTELGGKIVNSCDDVTLSFQDSLGEVSGPKHQKIYYREYFLTDGLTVDSCTVQYYIINTINPDLELYEDTLYLNATGSLTLTEELLVSFSADYCTDPVEMTFIDPSSVDGTDLGLLDITVTVIDSAENQTSLTTPVLIADNTPPSVDCPNDTTLIVQPCICETSFEFSTPIAIDELGQTITIIRTDTTGLESGDLFPVGITTLSYDFIDESGNITVCTYDVEVISADPGPITLKDSLHFSLSEICDGYPTAAMFLLGSPACSIDLYELTILDPDGNPIIEDSLRYFRNMLLDVEITYPCFDLIGTSQILIEDKFEPVITCISDTISCNEIPVFGMPMAEDNCDPNVQIILLNETLENVSCTDPNLSRIITRTYTAIDDDGSQADTCYQVLSIEKFDLNTVTFDGIDTLIYCGFNTILDDQGHPSPEISGSPMAGELPLWPDQNSMCGVSSMYEDLVISDNPCGTTIAREWTVFYWDCFQDGMRQFLQEINIVDTVGPTFTCYEDITLATEPFGCQATLALDLPMVNDLCNNGTTFNIQLPDEYIQNITSIHTVLPLGEHLITLEAEDNCGKINSCAFSVTVIDNEDPIAIVTNGFTVSLTNEPTELQAEVLNNGSFDACGDVTFSIARMDNACSSLAHDFQASTSICCEDVGNSIMIQFLVTDQSGNTNLAMVAVQVEDEETPQLVESLPNISIPCTYNYVSNETAAFGTFTSPDERDTLLQGLEGVLFDGTDLDGVVLDNCSTFTIEETITEDYNPTCGTGIVTRDFIITDIAGNSISSQQVITFYNPSPVTLLDIDWPSNEVYVNGSCTPADYLPSNIGLDPNAPFEVQSPCSDVAFDFGDDIDYGPFEQDTLFIINRQWTVADWCQNLNGTFASFDSTQLIVVLDTREPIITNACEEISACNFSPTCEDYIVSSSIQAMDECTSVELLTFSFEIDFYSDGTIDAIGQNSSLSLGFPLGEHLIIWTVKDEQANTDMCFQTVSIESCQFPTPICLQNQDFFLEAIDTNDDGTLDAEQVLIHPLDIDGGSFSTCGGTLAYSFSTDINDTIRLFDCEDLGEQIIQLYVLDENGNQDFCEVSIDILDNNSDEICLPDAPEPLMIQGVITNELGSSLDDVTVRLKGTDMATSTFDGQYAFPEMQSNQFYTLYPSYDGDPLDGISTLDIIKIRKHILGLDPITSPYLLLAADVNASGSINGQDIIELRKLILGKTLEFQQKEAWEFIPSEMDFIDPHNPWLNTIEDVTLEEMEGTQQVDYFALKTGDMNFSAAPFGHEEILTRSSTNLNYTINEEPESIRIDVAIENEADLTGFQFSFQYNSDLYAFRTVEKGAISINTEHVNDAFRKIGIIDISWDRNQDFTPSAPYSFSIIFDKITEHNASFFTISIFSEGLNPQAYYQNGDISSLRFQTKQKNTEAIELKQNHPNPWKDQTNISFFMPQSQYIEFTVYDQTGKIYVSKQGIYPAGESNITLDKSNFGGAGLYYYVVKTATGQYTKKMIRID